ncbi:uncharacterized protein LOC106666842 [Cimex lectularius]|uniref:Uncharacterized protein n=1 Tax=Cimex lectularius TaxID=79782 RepID=A0A8I6RRK4_CIMLE|nr:uncharacterized protein LOC106666842 [Cimex lectularius]
METMLKIVGFFALVGGCLSSVPLPGPHPGNEFFLTGPPYQRLQFGPNLYQPDFMKLPFGFPGHVNPVVYFDEPHGLNFPLNLQHFSPIETRPFGHAFPHPLSMNAPMNSFGLEGGPLGFPNFHGHRFPHHLTQQVGNEMEYLPELENARRSVRMPRDYPEESLPLRQNKLSNKIVFLNSKSNPSSLNLQKQNLTMSQPQFRDRTNQNLTSDDRQSRVVGQQLTQANDNSEKK